MSRFEDAADLVRIAGRKDPSPRTSAIIVAAGSSTRMGGEISKQLMVINGLPVLAHTLRAFEAADHIGEIVVVTRREDLETVWEIGDRYHIRKLTAVTHGGATRALSVQRGLAKIHPKARYVAIHDGARCLITPEQINRVCRAAYRHRAATAATHVTDTVKLASKHDFIESTIDRDRVVLVQTPQIFHTDLYRAALVHVKDTENLTDDNQLIERLPYPVKLVEIGADNLKITRPEDLLRAEWILQKREEMR